MGKSGLRVEAGNLKSQFTKTACRMSLVACLIICASGLPIRCTAASLAVEENPMIASFMFRDAPIEYAMSMLGDAWGRHIVVNDSAKETLVRTFLKNIDCLGALKAICHGHNLWYREDPDSRIIYIQTVDEFTHGGIIDEKKFVEVVTVTYPRCEDIAAALQEAYRDTFIYTAPDQDDDDEIGDISRALDRMDELGDRSTVLEGDSAQSKSTSSSGRGRQSTRNNRENLRGMENIRRYTDNVRNVPTYLDYTTRPNDVLVQAGTQQPTSVNAGGAPRMVQASLVFASIVRRSNSIVLRSTDREMLRQIKETIKQLDIPKPQVLLEMRILQLDVTDEKDREIDFLVNNQSHTFGSAGAGFSQNLADMQGGDGNMGALGIASAMALQDHSVFQLLNNHYQVRLNFLDGKGKVRSLATPSLLVADYEASRVFIGKEMSIVTDVEVTQTTTNGDNPQTVKSYNPTIQRRDVGTALVITPKVHADGTVTLRVMQENAEAGERTTIDYGGETTFDTYPIRKQTITSSVVAKDGETIALGGLMQHQTSETLHKIPWLGDIPYFGALFRHVSKDETDSELMVLIKPTVILTPSAAQPATRQFLRDNVRDKGNLHESMEKTRAERQVNADKKLSEENPHGTNTLFDANWRFDWVPTSTKEIDHTVEEDMEKE